MFKYLVLTLCIVFSFLLGMYFYVGVPKLYPGGEASVRNPHRMGESSRSISKISITAFYFVPKNKQENIFSDWHSVLEKKLDALVSFHTGQLEGESTLTYEIYPEPVIGLLDNIEYDTLVTQYGNPEALRRITPEIESRVLSSDGDGYVKGVGVAPDGTYHVLYIVYEGVGAIGGDNVALLSRAFLTEPEYSTVASSLFAHEFYHTLGLPDEYTMPHAVPTSQDIMGLGRYRPITQTFLSSKLLKELGL